MLLLAEWDKQKKKTWSGTTWFLKEALQKMTNVVDMSLNLPNKFTKAKFVGASLVQQLYFEKNMNFNPAYISYIEKKIQSNLQQVSGWEEEQIIQVGDLAKIKNSMIYQDLSISFLLACKKNDPESFQYSGFQKVSNKQLELRNEIQLERYDQAKKIFTMSKCLEQHLIHDMGFSKNKVIHIGGGTQIFNSKGKSLVKKNRKRILFIGRDFYRKGGDQVVRAFKLIQQSIPDMELYILGPKQLDEQFTGKNIFFLGDIAHEKIKYYFSLCDVFCMPSKFEAYGLVFIEALANGLPCIGLNKYEMPYFIEEGVNGYLVEADHSVETLANKIMSLMKNEDIFSYVAQQKAAYLHEYTWDSVAKRLYDYT